MRTPHNTALSLEFIIVYLEAGIVLTSVTFHYIANPLPADMYSLFLILHGLTFYITYCINYKAVGVGQKYFD